MDPARSLYALLVGINDYHPEGGVRPLRGCVNDARALARTLAELYGVPQENILTLVDEAAGRAAIEAAFRSHLIAPAQAWAQRQSVSQEPPPAFLFYFSGHGSQARDLTLQEPDGMDETLVAWDSRTPGVFDIRDWELGAWLAELNVAGEEVCAILDCCHSGSGTRDEEESAEPRARACPPDLRLPPSSRPVVGERGVSAPATRLRHVLLAGCRDRELARELAAPDGAGGTIWRGAMSYFLQQVLYERRTSAHPLSARELHEQVRARLHTVYTQQTPQVEGAIDRPLFGGAPMARDPFFTLLSEENAGDEGLVWVDAGLLHGVDAGSLLRAWPAATRTRAETASAAPLATLEVVRPGVDRSGCRLVSGRVTLPARATLEQRAVGAGRAIVRLELRAPQSLAATIAGSDLSAPWVEVGEAGATLRVVEGAEGARLIADAAGDPIAGPYAPAQEAEIARDLAHIARFRAVEALTGDGTLRGEGADAALAGAVSLQLRRLEFDEASGKPIAAPLERAAGEAVIEAGQKLVYEITNRSATPLYAALYALTEAFEVALVWPGVAGAHEAIGPGKSVAPGRSARRNEQYEAYLPEGAAEARDLYKLIVSPADFSHDLIEQGALATPYTAPRAVSASGLDRLLAATVSGVRDGSRPGSSPAAWTTVETSLRVIRPAPAPTAEGARAALPNVVPPSVHHAGEGTRNREQGTTAVDPRSLFPVPLPQVEGPLRAHFGSGQELAALGLTVEPPPGFHGALRLIPSAAALGDPALPPGLAAWGDAFRPYRPEQRVAAAPAIAIDADAASRLALSAQTPLRLRARRPFARPMLAIVWDGEGFYPAGRAAAGDEALAITRLPAPPESGTVPGSVPGARQATIGRALRLYLVELAAFPTDRLGLFAVRFVPDAWARAASRAAFVRKAPGGSLRYTPATRFRPGERVALLIHGFADDSAQEAHWLLERMAAQGVSYDRVLAFEYESIRTDVATNAERLRHALDTLGAGETEGVTVDLYAHSMGALIGRVWVELLGGDRIVREALLLAPPNRGTPLASAALLAPWLVTLALNLPAPTLPAVLVAWATGALALDAWGPADLMPDAPIQGRLLDAQTQPRTRYRVLAGEVDPLGAWTARPEKLLRTLAAGTGAAAAWFFDGGHDLVIPLRSALGLRAGRAPGSLLLTRVVASSHVGFFESEAAAEQAVRWLLPAREGGTPEGETVEREQGTGNGEQETAPPAPEVPAAPPTPEPEPPAAAPARPVIRFRKPRAP